MTIGELPRSGGTRYAWIDYDQEVRDAVFSCLDEALKNDYGNDYGNILVDTAIEVASDMGDYDPAFEGTEPKDIVAFVQEWQDEHRNA